MNYTENDLSGEETEERSSTLLTRRMLEVSDEALTSDPLSSADSQGCEADQLTDYLRSDGQDPLE